MATTGSEVSRSALFCATHKPKLFPLSTDLQRGRNPREDEQGGQLPPRSNPEAGRTLPTDTAGIEVGSECRGAQTLQ